MARAEQLDDPDDETLFLFLPRRPGTFYVEMSLYKDETASDLLVNQPTTIFRT